MFQYNCVCVCTFAHQWLFMYEYEFLYKNFCLFFFCFCLFETNLFAGECGAMWLVVLFECKLLKRKQTTNSTTHTFDEFIFVCLYIFKFKTQKQTHHRALKKKKKNCTFDIQKKRNKIWNKNMKAKNLAKLKIENFVVVEVFFL